MNENEQIAATATEIRSGSPIQRVSVRLLDESDAVTHEIELSTGALVLDVLLTGAEVSNVKLLPPNQTPLDQLHNLDGDKIGAAINDLDEPLEEYLKRPNVTHHFGIKLLRVFAVNNRWATADKPELTPRQILELVKLKFEEYTLYPPHSDKLLPLDTPVMIRRGERFEAQRDGKYGA